MPKITNLGKRQVRPVLLTTMMEERERGSEGGRKGGRKGGKGGREKI